MREKATILVVDDENGVRQSFNMVLKDDYNVLLAANGEEAMAIFKKNRVDLILMDIRLPDTDGVTLLQKLKEIEPDTEIIMVTAVKEIQTAVKAIKLGAYEYVIKPFVVDDVLTIISRALEKGRLVREVTYLRSELERVKPFEKMVGKDEKMIKLFDLISTVAGSDGAVLVQGESGTGKELVARAIHNRSPRNKKPFVVVNCAAIPSTLLESEIFGHTKGAFTGANSTKVGKLELADKGTVFLDDVDTLDTTMQGKLLRVIQEKEFERLGNPKLINVDIRFVAASNKNLPHLISRGDFREDLFYRLNVFPVNLPPLRDRKNDIPLLLNHFLARYSKKTGRDVQRFSEKAINSFMAYDWPGNVRELQNLVERFATITRKKMIDIDDISSPDIVYESVKPMKLKDAVNEFERKFIGKVIDRVGGSRKRAAEIMGIHRNTLLGKIKDLDINS
ncbi:MAG: sigma-54 dependent transcriptional regulator [Deltaproteobacteria bacterium]|nr:sigma-54 dependent transcriptional regulator [Deltaproteobacteria bacterium]